jgi:hypothetical protein
MSQRFPVLFTILILAACLLGAQNPTAGPVEIFPLDQVKPGLKGTAYTVFEGTQAEAFPVEILGRLKNQWGPGQDIILCKVGGKAGQTGVAAGMSGSPVYVDGKLLGALSLRIGVFPNEPIGGITHASYMLEVKENDGTKTIQTTQVAGKLPLPPEIQGMLNPALAGTGNDLYLVPIETPMVFSGFSEAVLKQFADTFRQLGIAPTPGGGFASGGMGGSSVTTAKVTSDAQKLKEALPPGAPVSGVLVAGDFSLAGSGTVTYNDGHKVLAFGHPFFNFGRVDIPMAKAEVVTTLGSTFSPFKIMNAGEVVGVLRQDRHSAIMGVLGESANMIPVEARIHTPSQSKTYHFEVFQNPKFTPFMIILTTFNTLAGINEYGEDLTYRMKANFELEGYPEVKLEQMYSAPENSPLPGPMALSFWLGDRFGRVFNNQWETPKVKNIRLDVELLPERRTATLENVWVEKNEVRAGEELNIRVFLRPYRGERVSRDLKFRIPATAPKGELRLQFSDADYANRYNAFLLMQNKMPGLSEIVTVLNRERSNGQIYVSLLQTAPTALVEDKVLPSIPASVASVIDHGRIQGRLTMMGETALLVEAIPVDYVLSGVQTVTITVK